MADLPLTTFDDFYLVRGAGSPIDDLAAGNRDLSLVGTGTAPRPSSHSRRRGAEFRASGFSSATPRCFASASPGTLHTALYSSSKVRSFTVWGWIRPSKTGITSAALTPIGGLFSETNMGATAWAFDQPCFLFTPITAGASHLIASCFGTILDTRTATQTKGSTSTTPIADTEYTFVALRVTGSTSTNNQIDSITLFTMSQAGAVRTYTLAEHKAAAVLAYTTNPSNNDTVTIQGRAYTFKTSLAGTPAQGKLVYSAGNFADGDTVVVGQDSAGASITYTARTYVGAAQAATQVIEWNSSVIYSSSTPKTRAYIGGWAITCLWGTKYPSSGSSGGLGFGGVSSDIGAAANAKLFDAWHGDYDTLADFKLPSSPATGTYDAGRSWANRRVVPGTATALLSDATEAAVARTTPLRALDAGTGGNACEVNVLEATAATGVYDLPCTPCRVGRNATYLFRLRAPSTNVIACALGAAGNIPNGTYKYTVTFTHASGESVEHNPTTIVMAGGPKKIELSTIPVGPSGTVSRKVYRTKVGGSTYFLLTTIGDNTTTTYSDDATDASLPTTTLPTTMYMIGGLAAAGTKSFLIGATYTDSQNNLIKAINATGTPGTEYSADITSANPTCSAAGSGNDIILTSKYAGSAGNGKPLSETSTPYGSVEAFGVTVLGVDGATADQVLIGTAAADTFQNLLDALNLTGSAGLQYGDPTLISSHVTASLTTGLLLLKSKESGTTGNGRTVATTVSGVTIRDEFNDKTISALTGGQAAAPFTAPSGARPDNADLRFVWGGWNQTATTTTGIFYGAVSDAGLANKALSDEECATLASTPPPVTTRQKGWYRAAHKTRVSFKTDRHTDWPIPRALATGAASQKFDLLNLKGERLGTRLVRVEAGRPFILDRLEVEFVHEAAGSRPATKTLFPMPETTGGLDRAAPPTKIGASQSPNLLNCSYEGRHLRGRRGYEIVNNSSTSTSAAKAAVFDATDALGDSWVLVLIDGTLYQLDGDTLLSLDTGWDQNEIPTVATVGLKTFILSSSRQRIFQQGSILTVGVTAPTNGPIYASASANVTGGVIALTPGYEYVYTFYDGTKATESGPSPITLVVLPTGSSPSSITFSLDVAASSTVTERRVYRRKVGTLTWRSVGAIENNTGTSFTDSSDTPGEDELDSPAGVFVTAEFPPITSGVEHEGRLVGFRDTEDGRQVWISEVGDGERWHVYNVFSASSEVMACISREGRLAVLTDRTVEVLEGDWVRGSLGTLGVSRRVLDKSKGCFGPHAACSGERGIYWADVSGVHRNGLGWDAKDTNETISDEDFPTMQAAMDTDGSGVVVRFNYFTHEVWTALWKSNTDAATGDPAKERVVMAYHVPTGRWADLDLALSYFEKVKDGIVGFRFMGADSYGNILDLNLLDGDGLQGNESLLPAAPVLTAVSATAKTVTMATAVFPTDGSLRGASCVLEDVSAGKFYRTVVLSNTATELTLSDFPSVIGVGDKFYLGGIIQLVDSKDVDGGRPGSKVFHSAAVSFADATDAAL